MGRGTVAMVWLVMLVGIGAAYGMGVADGRKRARGPPLHVSRTTSISSRSSPGC